MLILMCPCLLINERSIMYLEKYLQNGLETTMDVLLLPLTNQTTVTLLLPCKHLFISMHLVCMFPMYQAAGGISCPEKQARNG